jgi:hypothetical protein
MSRKTLTILLVLGALTGSVAVAQEALSDKRLDLAKQLLNNSDFPGQIMRAIGPQLSLDLTERYKKLGKPAEEKVVNDFLAEFGKAMKGRLDTALGEATPAVARVFTEDELAALVQMSGTPVGKSALEKFPSYFGTVMSQVGPMLQREVPGAIKETSDTLKQRGIDLPQ